MKGRALTCLLAAVLLLAVSISACAEVHFNEEVPPDWYERELFRLYVIDTDRSDAMLLQCGGESMLVDSGDGGHRNKLMEAVDAYGVTELKYLFSSHSDDDHIHGFKYLIESEKYEIGAFLSAEGLDYVDGPGYHQVVAKAIVKHWVPYQRVEDGDELTLGGAHLRVMRCNEPWGRNDRSATLMISFGESRVFLTGDIDNLTMRYYVEHFGEEALRADILKSPHHGIATIPDEFLNAVGASVIFVNNLEEKVPRFRNSVNYRAPETLVLFSGDASVLLETDGVDWYVQQ